MKTAKQIRQAAAFKHNYQQYCRLENLLRMTAAEVRAEYIRLWPGCRWAEDEAARLSRWQLLASIIDDEWMPLPGTHDSGIKVLSDGTT